MIGYACCGSFCTLSRSLAQMEALAKKYELFPIVSSVVATTDTRFGKAADFLALMEAISGRAPITTIAEAEPLGPAIPLEALIIAPCTGNTLAKMANGITDTSVTMAAKAHLRNGRPLIIALASNDALSANLRNIGTLLERKNVFFVPLGQDDPKSKPHSMVCNFARIDETLTAALEGRQLQPILTK
ncbi:MAG: dipicolinate synthase subunit B [Clostridia bacterium]|nr:dipicolinate synthase subunit B [Clostridia bacterium]